MDSINNIKFPSFDEYDDNSKALIQGRTHFLEECTDLETTVDALDFEGWGEILVEVDTKTGIAYTTCGDDDSLDVDELNPWEDNA